MKKVRVNWPTHEIGAIAVYLVYSAENKICGVFTHLILDEREDEYTPQYKQFWADGVYEQIKRMPSFANFENAIKDLLILCIENDHLITIDYPDQGESGYFEINYSGYNHDLEDSISNLMNAFQAFQQEANNMLASVWVAMGDIETINDSRKDDISGNFKFFKGFSEN